MRRFHALCCIGTAREKTAFSSACGCSAYLPAVAMFRFWIEIRESRKMIVLAKVELN